ncbi:MAG: hypothetical protein J6X66_08615 [Lachnospiraceae bacterium]|nr:hypothetical protein [Lachnospiraceae bacterium]
MSRDTAGIRKKKRRIKPSKVLGAYFIYIAVLIILSIIVLLILWLKLADYQKSMDRKETALAAAEPTPLPEEEKEKKDIKQAQTAFERYANSMDMGTWTGLWLTQRPDDPEDEAVVSDYFSELIKNEGTSYYLDPSYDEKKPVYKIKIGSKDAARVYMQRDVVGKWTIGDTELLYKGDYSADGVLPEGMEFLINGVKAEPSAEGEDHFPYSSIKNTLIEPVRWQEYSIDGLLCEPEVSYGNEDGFEWSEDDNCYLALAVDVDADDLKNRAEGFFKAYMNYTMSGGAGWKDYRAAQEAGQANSGNPVAGRFAACVAYVPSDSVAYSMLQKAFDSTCYALAYTDHDYGLSKTRGPIRWAENCVGVDFFYHAYATLNGQRKDYSGEDQLFRVFFINIDGSWKIWAFSA